MAEEGKEREVDRMEDDTNKEDEVESAGGQYSDSRSKSFPPPVQSTLRSRSRSRSRSPSYSPSPPGSTTLNRPSLSPRSGRSSISRSPGSGLRRRRSSSDDGRPNRREGRAVEVTGLTRMMQESHLDQIFGFYGAISEIALPKYRRSGENQGKGWVMYRSSACAQKAEEYMDGGQIDGVIISVRQAHMPDDVSDSRARSQFDLAAPRHQYDTSRSRSREDRYAYHLSQHYRRPPNPFREHHAGRGYQNDWARDRSPPRRHAASPVRTSPNLR